MTRLVFAMLLVSVLSVSLRSQKTLTIQTGDVSYYAPLDCYTVPMTVNCNRCVAFDPSTPSPVQWRIEGVTKTAIPENGCKGSFYKDETDQWWKCKNSDPTVRDCTDWAPFINNNQIQYNEEALVAAPIPTCELSSTCSSVRTLG